MDWSNVAFVFPGQGSQVVGMAKDIADAYPAAHDVIQQADAILDFPLSALMFSGAEDVLNDTINTQPALFVSGIAILHALKTELPDAQPAFVAGHSLGEFTALAAAGALSFSDGLRLVRERGRLMKDAGDAQPGAMAAILGLDADRVRDVCAQAAAETGGVLVLANDNCPGQVVISGENAALDHGLVLAKSAGAKKAIKLAVSIAAHSPLMQRAAARFAEALANTEFKQPVVPVYGNVSAAPLTGVDAIRHELETQLTQSVRWTESVQRMVADGANVFVEFGPKDVLTGLLKRIDGTKTAVAINSLNNLRQFLEKT
ncbi:MAG: ACP S-malonyltransferase [Anaerolinea sp.]|nr:ACP S-malonyltransferase [Anaerolinea sp.]